MDFIKSLEEHAVFKFSVAIWGTAATLMFGEFSQALLVLAALIGMDYLTGWLAGYKNRELSSKVGMKGIKKKIGIVLMVCLAHLLDVSLGSQNTFRDMAIYFFLANEGLSIIENLSRAGVPIPSAITKALEIINDKSETKEE